MRVCSIDACERKYYAKGYCNMHYQRWRRYNDPLVSNHVQNYHGNHGHPLYKIWHAAKSRCHNENDKAFHYYGARGITMCVRWRDNFQNFLDDMGERPSKNHTLDRVDNNQGYSKENCRWATKAEQSQNTRRTKLNPVAVKVIRYLNNKGVSQRKLSKTYGVDRSCIRYVINGKSWRDVA